MPSASRRNISWPDAATGASPETEVIDAFHAAVTDEVAAAEHELLKGQVEFACKPVDDPGAAHEALRVARRGMAKVADAHGLALFAAGSHPLGSFERQDTTKKERYRKLEEQFGIIAHRSMCCAMHVHVELPEGEDRILVMNRLVLSCPCFSRCRRPLLIGRARTAALPAPASPVFAEWPRMGLPALLSSEVEYEQLVDTLVGTGMMENSSFLWWLIRPSNKYPTIELRVCDACTRADDSVAIASLYRCLVRACVRQPKINAGIEGAERVIAAENIWQAQRHGVHARFIDAATRSVISVAEALEAALAIAADEADALGCADWVARTRDIVANGSSSDRQRAVFATARANGAIPRDALAAVVAALAAETLLDRIIARAHPRCGIYRRAPRTRRPDSSAAIAAMCRRSAKPSGQLISGPGDGRPTSPGRHCQACPMSLSDGAHALFCR